MLVQWHDIHLAFPDKHVLDGVSLTVHPGDKLALVGENGAGKTCLFRVLRGDMKPDRGEITRAADVRLGYLEQTLIDERPELAGRTCFDLALEPFSALQDLEARIAALSDRLGRPDVDGGAGILDQFGEAQAEFEALGGYTYRARTEAALAGLGLDESSWARPVAELSAGQKVRLALVRLLLSEFDLLLLDEPTNHLDVAAREWLEAQLVHMEAAYVVTSHDRRFLDAVARKVAHLDRGRLSVYPGNYTAFRAQVDQQTDAAQQLYEKRQKQVRKLEAQARDYRNWSGSRERDKRGAADKGYVGHKAAKLMKRVLVAERRLNATITAMKMEKPFEKDRVAIDFHASAGRQLLSARALSIGFAADAPLAEAIDLTLAGGDRLAVLGPNGCGKTTLIRTLLGEQSPLGGEVRLAPSVNLGYFDQENRQIAPETTALAAVLATGKDETLVRTIMGRMRIRRETVNKAVGRLSAGERAKVLLARLILGEHNLLILDEPTNHLDIETQDPLLDALSEFPGGILFVSHDRHFVDTLATMTLALRRG